jgi:hypothetical protein
MIAAVGIAHDKVVEHVFCATGTLEGLGMQRTTYPCQQQKQYFLQV